MSPGKVSRRVVLDRCAMISSMLDQEQATLLERLAGYRNRLVHFYQEVNPEELREIAAKHLDDVVSLRDAFIAWMADHPDMVDEAL